MAELRIALLGPPRVERDKAPIEVDTRKAIAMLAYLAIHPERHGRDAVAGLLWPWITKLGLGRLPGDVVVERENFRLYLPITTSILISVALSLIVWLLNR